MTMAAFVTGVSALIHLYSIGYMEHDEDYSKFFLYLNLFVFSMLMLVLADNFLVTSSAGRASGSARTSSSPSGSSAQRRRAPARRR